MLITFEELRSIKHSLPTGSIKKIAQELNIDEQYVRNYFGAQKASNIPNAGWHKEAGPHGAVLNLEDTTILNLAKKMISRTQTS